MARRSNKLPIPAHRRPETDEAEGPAVHEPAGGWAPKETDDRPWEEALASKLKLLPKQPGVYLFRDLRGRVLYVGKAVNLASRVRSYFRADVTDQKTLTLRARLRALDYVALQTEMEALILESHLIKQYAPRFNIQLKDDKKYPYIKVTTGTKFPGMFLTRHIVPDGSRYFGPFIKVKDLRRTLRTLRSVFQLRNCTDQRLAQGGRECLQYFIGNCTAPCTERVAEAGYRSQVDPLLAFLSGQGVEVLDQLRERMRGVAAKFKYEEASRLRDGIDLLDLLMKEQRMTPPVASEADVIGLASRGNQACAVFLHVREGKVLGKSHRLLRHVTGADDGETLRALLLALFLDSPSVPGQLITRTEPHDREGIEAILTERSGHRVHLRTRQRGDLARLLRTAEENAHLLLEEEQLLTAQKYARVSQAVYELQSVLDLARPPYRIEGFDISNFQGSFPVASVVSFRDGKPWKSGYRRIKMDSIPGPDDFAMIGEAVRRRLLRIETRGEVAPDLILIDGGIGQVGRAREVAEELGYGDIPLVGLAKKEEEIVLPRGGPSIRLPRSSEALRLLQRVRDESHRFAVTYHRQRRGKAQRSSRLDEISGVGPSRRRALLQHFGSLRAIRAASTEDIATVPGIGTELARSIRQNLDGQDVTKEPTDNKST